ncbi:S-adenosylmethionine:tRNA ribosyltransferase-isomerase [Litoribacter alkaliphilus]|uniref:S-adenosylmethionine:tRNA ribosyltransferase-isomerase n=1 Tax=Litoribacter ruber TaxID=702568 RepID=A0AAP2CL17_9BACT|nr:S-adenosylmethionine:tRNA ribosyltransferase-isomerase [Litoribacter alkaliphilus]MBS9525206.1 S-adenosylmethionine:tRNA ribosyltransferase-isomerase [Litoribacter alkaliphilus]
MSDLEKVRLSDYHYELPDERIAKFPLPQRDSSKLLHFEDGEIAHHRFDQIPTLIPENSLLVFNNTKVIPARLIFQKATGARIEIFLLKPYSPSLEINQIMAAREEVAWECMIGNLKKWKEGEILQGKVQIDGEETVIEANLIDRESRKVAFTWNSNHPFVSVVEATGEVPLPPYLNRKATDEDKPRYQTVYSKKEGAVAAPTAGLHFTPEILAQLEARNISQEFLTLHVSAGTFQPIKEELVNNHPMHSEQLVIGKETIINLLGSYKNIIAVGTTSMRTLESLYWYGVKIINGDTDFFIPKLFPYQHAELPTYKESFQAILNHMEKSNLEEIVGSTEIFILPGYSFRVCNGLVTNFHQPASTLILLVAAFSKGRWREIYNTALNNDYRFLSYGDSSLLWHKKNR